MPTCRSDRAAACASPVRVSLTGSAFPAPPFECAVHSVFRSALNLRVTGRPDLCSLVSSPDKAHPLAATLAAGADGAHDLSAWGLVPGCRGAYSGDVLSFDGSLAPAVLFPASTGADAGSLRDGAERMPGMDPVSSAVRRRISAAEAVLEAQQAEAGAALRYAELSGRDVPRTAFGRRFAASARALASGATAATGEGALTADAADALLRGLVGFGEGLTPAGDDFVVGFLGALNALAAGAGPAGGNAGDAGSAQALGALSGAAQRAVSDAPASTNEISAAFLASAAKGLFSLALVSFADAVADSGRPESDIGAALRLLGSVGHSSGLDAASGFLFGIRCFWT